MHAAQVAISFTLIKHGGRAGQGLEQGEKIKVTREQNLGYHRTAIGKPLVGASAACSMHTESPVHSLGSGACYRAQLRHLRPLNSLPV